MRIAPFELERWQSLHEHSVAVNLSDSGAHPLTVAELLGDEAAVAALGAVRLGYTQTNGSQPLRAGIAALHDGATPDHVLVTTGGIEANFLSVWHLVEPGDEVVVMQPNYGQIAGLAASLGATVRDWWLTPDWEAGQWRASVDALEGLLGPRTRMVCICNPNNPTGAAFDGGWLDAVAARCESVGAWLLADEIYRGSELTDAPRTPTAFGRTERVIVTGSLSKAWGLPGLRLGWAVTTPDLTATLWHHHDYTTITSGALSDALATVALTSPRREELMARARAHLVHNLGLCQEWLAATPGFRTILPAAGAMLWCELPGIDTQALVETLRRDHGVLLVPGEHYRCPGWIRIGFGCEPETLLTGLAALTAAVGPR